MQPIIYFLIAIVSTTAGAIAGIGGGIIMRPVLDILGDFDVQSISMLSSLTVLVMSFVSAGKQLMMKTVIDFKIVLPLAIGAALGGTLGQHLLTMIVNALEMGQTVTVIQNALLLIMAISVFVYMRRRASIESKNLSGKPLIVLTGLVLGVLAAFLGIGGGPINIAVVIFLFSFNIKTAMVCSIVVILFSQSANAIYASLTVGFGAFNLQMLPPMMIGAVAGGFIGAILNKKLSERVVENCFNVMQGLVATFAIFNIISGLNYLS
ncbi:MAG: sulfite exporter TauE/SafE family protein [Oscillospiraceae bacterium]|nr:sulfite exporter TauE/SafE family protein [Oscillospiraceae bacterium]